MNKLLIALTLCIALTACKQQDAADATPAAQPPAAAEPAVTPPAADSTSNQVATTGNADLPKECQDFLDRAKTCLSRGNAALAAQFQASIDAYKEKWQSSTDHATLAPQCVKANTNFDSTAAALKCE